MLQKNIPFSKNMLKVKLFNLHKLGKHNKKDFSLLNFVEKGHSGALPY